MPIDYKRYGKKFRKISKVLRGIGICAFCGNRNGETNPRTGSKVVLTVHHMDNDVKNNDPGNLVALCQQCHFAANKGKYPYLCNTILKIWISCAMWELFIHWREIDGVPADGANRTQKKGKKGFTQTKREVKNDD